ncbi:MAG: DUF515 domain-containing protein [Methanobacterium sp.]
MLDRIRGKKDDDDKKSPVLRGNNNNNNKKDDSDIGERLKGMVNRVSGKKGSDKDDKKKESPKRKMPRPMPKPIAKSGEVPRLRPPPQKPDDKKPRKGGLGGFGRRIPDDDQRTLVGAAVFAIILIVLVGAGYYFLVYAPYQNALGNAKQSKINEVNAYFTGPLATDPRGIDLRLQIDSAQTPESALAVDVLGPATMAWREYQTQQIQSQKDPYGRVMVVYNASGQKDIILKVADAQTLVSQADASVLSKTLIKTPDTVAIPIRISRLQAAGGLINVGNSVDVYLQNQTSTNTTNYNNNTPDISGATVLAILRDRGSGEVDASVSDTQLTGFNNLINNQSAHKDVEQLLRASASRDMNEAQVSALLNSYGFRLSDFERASNLGDLNAEYLILLEVPRENAIFLIKNSKDVILTVPTQQAPNWMIKELKAIYS